MITSGSWLRIGAIWGFLAVSLGALGAHGLQERFKSLGELSGQLTAERLEANFHTGTAYHMYSALALLAIGVLAAIGRGSSALQLAGWSHLLGSLVFSGSLYLVATTGIRWFGAITPIGGVVILVGWLALAVAAGTSSTPRPDLLR
jgi:uncharacterized membrane protein YgdD (TMEM256/DUF423 family)